MDDELFGVPTVPDGHIGVTVSVHGIKPFTMAIEASATEDVLAFVERASGFGPRGRRNRAVHEAVRRATEHMLWHLPGEAELLRQTAAMAVLWCALNHPKQGAKLRAELSDDLRTHGSAHLLALADARHAWRYVPGCGAADVLLSFSGLFTGPVSIEHNEDLEAGLKRRLH